MLAKGSGLCPPATDWNNDVGDGLTPITTNWIRVQKDGGDYVNSTAGASLSKVHTYMRQLRVVVLNLREKLDLINEEIKSLLKIREGLARSLDQLNIELSSNRADAVIKRPRFIKNRSRDVLVPPCDRGGDTVRMQRHQMKNAQMKLRKQYMAVREQLQTMGKIRNQMGDTILERTRILELCPEIIAASTRCRHVQIEQKTKSQQVMLQYAMYRGGLINVDHRKMSPRRRRQQLAAGGDLISGQPSNESGEARQQPRCTTATGYREAKQPVLRQIKSAHSAGNTTETTKAVRYEHYNAEPTRQQQQPQQAWEGEFNDCLCGVGTLPPPMTAECSSAIRALAECRKTSKGLRKKTLSIVEDCYLCPSIPCDDVTYTPPHGVYYGVACGGRCHRKCGTFAK